MPKKHKRAGKDLSRGPFTCADLARGFQRIGYRPVKPGDHLNFKHPNRPGKVQLDQKWTEIKVGGWVWRSLCRQSGFSKSELQRIMNGLDP